MGNFPNTYIFPCLIVSRTYFHLCKPIVLTTVLSQGCNGGCTFRPQSETDTGSHSDYTASFPNTNLKRPSLRQKRDTNQTLRLVIFSASCRIFCINPAITQRLTRQFSITSSDIVPLFPQKKSQSGVPILQNLHQYQ